MDNDGKLRYIKRKTRQRFLFAALTLVFYFTFIAGYTEWGQFLWRSVGQSPVNWALLQFIFLVLLFIVFELVFLWLNRKSDQQKGQQ